MGTHVADLHAFLDYYFRSDVASQQDKKPIIIAHSFGGMLAMKYLEEYASQNNIGYVSVSARCV